MGNFFDRISGRKRSAKSAKERLQLVLIHDRTDLTQAEIGSVVEELNLSLKRLDLLKSLGLDPMGKEVPP